MDSILSFFINLFVCRNRAFRAQQNLLSINTCVNGQCFFSFVFFIHATLNFQKNINLHRSVEMSLNSEVLL